MDVGFKGFSPGVSVQPPSLETQLRRGMVGGRVVDVSDVGGQLQISMENGFVFGLRIEDVSEEDDEVP